MSKRWIAIAAAGVLLGCMGYLLSISPQFLAEVPPTEKPIPHLVVAMMLAGLAYVVCIKSTYGVPLKYSLIWAFLGVGLLMRLIMIPSDPMQENDYNRYFFDGFVTLEGINPYDYSPDEVLNQPAKGDIRLEKLQQALKRDPIGLRFSKEINYKELKTIYPPVAQAIFAAVQYLAPWNGSLWVYVLLCFDLLTLLLLWKLCRYLGVQNAALLVYWLNPILVKEFYNSVHMDLILLPFILGAILFTIKGKIFRGTTLLGLAVGVKIWPVILLPFLLRFATKTKREALAVVGHFTGICGLIFLPMALASSSANQGIIVFSKIWKMNDALFQFFMKIFQVEMLAKFVIIALIGVWIFVLVRREIKDPRFLMRQMFLVVAVMLILLPTQFPWYYMWLLPFLCFEPRTSMLCYMIALPIYYLRFYIEDKSLFDFGITYLEHGAIYLIILWEMYQGQWNPSPLDPRANDIGVQT